MPFVRLMRATAAAVVLVGSAAVPAGAQVTYRTVVTTGNSGAGENLAPGLPNGGTFTNANNNNALNGFGAAGTITNSGEVTFTGSLTGVSSTGIDAGNNTGIWSEAGGSLHLVVREGDFVPASGPEVFGDFASSGHQVNNLGQTAFQAPVGSAVGVWSNADGNGFAQVVRTGDVAPGANGATFTSGFGFQMNNAGEIAFAAGTVPGSSIQGRGIWSNVGGTLNKVALMGDAAPGTGGATFANNVSFSMQQFSFNDGGSVQFQSALSGVGVSSTNDTGLWSTSGGSLQLLAREGDSLGSVGPGISLGQVSGSGLLNNADHSAVRALLTGTGVTTGNNQAILTNRNGAGWETIARTGAPAPVGVAGAVFGSLFINEQLGFNNSGQAQFVATLAGAGVMLDGTQSSPIVPGNERAIFSEGGGNGLAVVARKGDVAPGTNGAVFGHNYAVSGADNTFTNLRFNNAGQTAFVGNLAMNIGDTDAGLLNDQGIWATDPFGTLQLVVRRNDTVLDFYGNGNLLSPTRNFDSLILGDFNDQGQLTFAARAQNNSAATTLFVADLGSASVVGNSVNIAGGRSISVPGGVTVGNSLGVSSHVEIATDSVVLSQQGVTIFGNSSARIDATSSLIAPVITVSGALELNGTLTGDVYLADGGVLSGSGLVDGTVFAADGSILSFGNSPGMMTVENFVFGAGDQIFRFEIADALGAPGDAWDLLTVSDSLVFDPATRITIDMITGDFDSPVQMANFDNTQSYSWLFMESLGEMQGFDNAIFEFLIDPTRFLNPYAQGQFSVSRSGNQLFVDFSPSTASAVPEPSSLALLCFGSVGLAGGLWRKRRGSR